MRGRSDEVQKKRLVTGAVIATIFLVFLYVYQGSLFGSENRGSAALEYGSKSLKRFGWSGDADADAEETSSKFTQEDEELDVVPKSFPVSSSFLMLCLIYSKMTMHMLDILCWFVSAFSCCCL